MSTEARNAAMELSRPPPVGTPAPRARIRMLRLSEVIEVTGLGKTKIYELQSLGQFPMRIKITSHSVGWVEEDVQIWLARRIAANAPLRTR